MSFEQQSTSDVLTRLKEDLLKTNNTAAAVEGSFNGDMLTANSIEFAKAYNEMNLIIEAAFANTSWGDYLTMRAAEFGVIRKEATAAIVDLKIKGTAGSKIIKNSLFATASDIRFYTLNDAVISNNGYIITQAQCNIVGTSGNVDANTITKIPYSIPGVQSVVNEQSAHDGYDEETDEALLGRYLLKVRTPATSGNVYHYKQWALSIAGVGQCKVLPLWNGNGTVKVIMVDDNNNTASDDLIKKVADYIESVRPIGATVTVTSPVPFAINIEATIIGSGDTDKVKETVNNYFKNNGFGLEYVSVARIGKTLLDSGITDYDYDTLKVNGSNEDITLNDDQLPVCGEVILNARK